MQRTHRWVLGGVSGFFFGLFLGTTLLLFGVIPLKSPLLTLLPVAFIVLGAAWGSWGPIGRRRYVPDTSRNGLVVPAVPDIQRPTGATAPDQPQDPSTP
jgi:hypothetical protein